MSRFLLTITIIILGLSVKALSCPVCKTEQPKGLENITHGQGPAGISDFVITWIAVIIVAITLYLSIKYLVKPKEDKSSHIKNIVINEFN